MILFVAILLDDHAHLNLLALDHIVYVFVKIFNSIHIFGNVFRHLLPLLELLNNVLIAAKDGHNVPNRLIEMHC